MNNFWALVKFEYKKIFYGKIFWVGAILLIGMMGMQICGTIIGNQYTDGKISSTKYDAMVLNRDQGRAISGRAISSELILEVSQAYGKVSIIDGINMNVEEYRQHALEYDDIMRLLSPVYNKVIAPRFGMVEMQNMTEEQADNFYQIREKKLFDSIARYDINETSKNTLMSMNSQVKTPIVFEFHGGYDKYKQILFATPMMITLFLAVCLAPLFAGEFTKGTDQLILSSKNGKKSQIHAKTFVGITMTIGVFIFIMGVAYLLTMSIYGFDGANGAIQLMNSLILSPYPLTIGQATIICLVCALLACVLASVGTMFLSAKCNSPFVVIVVSTVLILLPRIIRVPNTYPILYRLYVLLPVNMMGDHHTFTHMLHQFFDVSLPPYVVMPIFSMVASVLILPFVYRNFRNHQIS